MDMILEINTLRPRQNGRHFPDDIFKCIFLNENVWISIKVSLTFVPNGPINNIPALVQIMAWRRSGDKPLSEPVMVSLLTHICVTRPQWVNCIPGSTHGSSVRWPSIWVHIITSGAERVFITAISSTCCSFAFLLFSKHQYKMHFICWIIFGYAQKWGTHKSEMLCVIRLGVKFTWMWGPPLGTPCSRWYIILCAAKPCPAECISGNVIIRLRDKHTHKYEGLIFK